MAKLHILDLLINFNGEGGGGVTVLEDEQNNMFCVKTASKLGAMTVVCVVT